MREISRQLAEKLSKSIATGEFAIGRLSGPSVVAQKHKYWILEVESDGALKYFLVHKKYRALRIARAILKDAKKAR